MEKAVVPATKMLHLNTTDDQLPVEVRNAMHPLTRTPPQVRRIGRVTLALAVVQIVLGLLAIILESVALWIYTRFSYQIDYAPLGTGVWCGLFFVVAGLIGVITARNETKCRVISFMVLSIIAACFAAILIIISGINIGVIGRRCYGIDPTISYVEESPNDRYDYDYGANTPRTPSRTVIRNPAYSQCEADHGKVRNLTTATLLFGLAEMIVAIWCSALCCKVACCGSRGNESGQEIVVYQPRAATKQPTAPPDVAPFSGSIAMNQNIRTEITCDLPYYSTIGPAQTSPVTIVVENHPPPLPRRPHQAIDSMQVLLIERICEGSTSEVHKATVHDLHGRGERTLVAVKCVARNKLTGEFDQRVRNQVEQEIRILQEVPPHDNIMTLLAYADDPTRGPLLITEYMEHGDLKSLLQISSDIEDTYLNMTGITMQQVMAFAFDIAKGCEHLASFKYLNRDLSARSVLVNANMTCKLTNFGSAREVIEYRKKVKKSGIRIPVRWMAPESLQFNTYTVEGDVWSYGVLLWELLTLGATPYPECQTAAEAIEAINSGQLMEKPLGCTDDLYALMRGCWVHKPEKRLTFTKMRGKVEGLLGSFTGYTQLANTLTREMSLDPHVDIKNIEELL
ncbi:PREDICTED: proto-oncogene tyrosine-protein kinase receptor Ret-like [Priapulus caudatus]|uniref:Proto-oncogene tyrosine-protein kinase receptor Ret-like n=1 Tax=Priapulus caudatus TaxID=37621 RepID=A0ABM1DQ67_PRICU|nr:PREDICTED: proto-oncogene tyrosine-protein kinase receptor Ret-like [Priapulus caudatus]